MKTLSATEAALVEPAADAGFTVGELDGLPEPAKRHLAVAIRPGTPLSRSSAMRMRGRIKVGRWLPFHAREVLSPHRGFVWSARAAWLLSGADRLTDDGGAMEWKLAGVIPVVRANGPDVTRSAAGRAGAEAVWLPTALLPRFGVKWSSRDEHHIAASFLVADVPVELHMTLDANGRILSFVVDRWGDPDGTGNWGMYPFGGEVTGYRTFDGVSIPSEGCAGWCYGTERWPRRRFFRYRITALELLGTTPAVEGNG